jgi:hypothetical protein
MLMGIPLQPLVLLLVHLADSLADLPLTPTIVVEPPGADKLPNVTS